MDGQTVGFIGGALGAIIGLMGGAVGTYFSITNTESPAERAFMIRVSVYAWIAIIIFLALLLLLPKPYNFYMWGVYGVFLPWGIHYINKNVKAIREAEQSHNNL
ncbi:hypothetical protein [Candidatus Thiodiazotropha sp. CDECU1]|uniref:hypothetical protein n=1 Tax=Candidatus Thiodiazotropha sp. CDECU1 TaxID=3065865 RepID=UPI00292E94CC|nr:hypothetical protein [Candidatus Thiodiazotropha sp. CDECU1]